LLAVACFSGDIADHELLKSHHGFTCNTLGTLETCPVHSRLGSSSFLAALTFQLSTEALAWAQIRILLERFTDAAVMPPDAQSQC
jgi:hypothetical protein